MNDLNNKIYGLGEIVFDIFFKENQPVEARPGGAVLNMMVSLARLGMPVSIIADMVNDKVGQLIHNFLKENQIDDSAIFWHQQGRSRLALAFLNSCSDAEYLFYKMQHEVIPDFKFPTLKPNDMLIFGSYYAIKPLIRHLVSDFLKNSYKQGAFVLYDPNFRKSHLNILNDVLPFIEENIKYSHITKASIEDCEIIWKTHHIDEIFKIFKQIGGKYLILTRASKPVLLYTPNKIYEFKVNKIKPVSTVGAGDAFMAGIAYAIRLLGIKPDSISNINEVYWQKIIKTAIETSTMVCLTYDNYIPTHKVNEIEAILKK
ncbi:MAG: fructokinase [Bacteroidales bacterium]|nr:fructokinase [Bacteroidales bacterium]